MLAREEGKAEPVVDQYSANELQNAGRLKQIRMVAKLVNQQNKRALPITFGAAAGVIVVFVLLALFVGPLALFLPIGILLGLMTAMILFGRFAQQAQYSAIDGSSARRPRCFRTCAATGTSPPPSPATGRWTWSTGRSAGPG